MMLPNLSNINNLLQSIKAVQALEQLINPPQKQTPHPKPPQRHYPLPTTPKVIIQQAGETEQKLLSFFIPYDANSDIKSIINTLTNNNLENYNIIAIQSASPITTIPDIPNFGKTANNDNTLITYHKTTMTIDKESKNPFYHIIIFNKPLICIINHNMGDKKMDDIHSYLINDFVKGMKYYMMGEMKVDTTNYTKYLDFYNEMSTGYPTIFDNDTIVPERADKFIAEYNTRLKELLPEKFDRYDLDPKASYSVKEKKDDIKLHIMKFGNENIRYRLNMVPDKEKGLSRILQKISKKEKVTEDDLSGVSEIEKALILTILIKNEKNEEEGQTLLRNEQNKLYRTIIFNYPDLPHINNYLFLSSCDETTIESSSFETNKKYIIGYLCSDPDKVEPPTKQ